ncbi:MAG: alpha/beta hydrolase [Rhodospirillales bacterium]|nr:alpha/beta hydrolase [Rhodospirillales bacterium]
MNESPRYQGYNQAQLDAQYDNRSRVPGHVDIHAAYEARGDAALADFETRLDVSYGPSDAETLDIFLPPGPAPAGGAPVNVFLHGGYWYSRHKNDFRFLARGLVPAGAVLVVVNYALVPSVDLDELIGQCRTAVAWTYQNAAGFGADPERLFVSGHSAGGHLGAMMMATDWPAFSSGLPTEMIKGGCVLSGIYDLAPIPMSYMQDTLGFTPDQVARNSPLLLKPATEAPLIVGVGGDESEEFLRQSATFADQWASAGTPCRSMVLPGINHFTILGEFADPASDITRAVQTQMELG